MINSLDIRNFQSLKTVHLDLGPFTVIVGDSNCGKSALARSIQALASNFRGNSVVTHGAKIAYVSAVTDFAKVTLEKGEGHGSYRVTSGSDDREFTKLAGEVPEAVSRALELDPVKEGISLNFAPQHEPPFLLTSSGSVVARTLGDLTKVNVVLEAVREANRRRTSSSGELKLRIKDLESVDRSLSVVDKLGVRKEAILDVGRLINNAQSIEDEIHRLTNIVDILNKSYAEVAPVYDISNLVKAYEDFNSLYRDLEKLRKLSVELESATKFSEHCTALSDELEVQFHEALEEVGECPLCGQIIV